MTLFWLAALYLLNMILLIAVAIQEVNRPVRALVWVVIGLVFPLAGFFFYLILSRPLKIQRQGLPPLLRNSARQISVYTSGRHRANHTQQRSSRNYAIRTTGSCHPCLKGSSADIAKAIQRIVGARPLSGKVQVLTNGPETYASLLQSLKNATWSIDIEYYIFRDDHAGNLVLQALLQKAQAGVRVRFLRDGFGSRRFPKSRLREMAQAGIKCKTFFPLRFPWVTSTMNHRDHCKIVVVDGKEGFVGGINVGDEYLGTEPQTGPWRDTHLRLLGDPVRELAQIFESNWQVAEADFKSVKESESNSGMKSQSGGELQIKTRKLSQGKWGIQSQSRRSATASLNFNMEIGTLLDELPPLWNSEIQTIQSGPDTKVQSIHELFFLGLTMARHSVEITTPYFVPDSDIVVALKTAAMRGVRVRLLVPLEPDHKIIALASHTYYAELLEAGVEIYLYQTGVLHAKVMTLDKGFAIVGAANFDMRSFRLNYEVCEVIYREEVARDLIDQFERDLVTSKELTLQLAEHESLVRQITEKGARILAQWL